MADYIERKAFLEHMKKTNRYFDVKFDIEGFPAADVAPVVHGEWLLRHEGCGHYWECSVCHTNPCIYVTEHTKFCPNCGARMDGGDNDDKSRDT